ncbi:hypothetical protein RhiirA5_439440 [Rhizophagus irregularis]|uniref:Uncharacterized protein n=1 Tax=Rhizophagus irregularis TaxID=588596 RepID=A0A2N0NHU8_9GLOM|nr:hypothetical protein RhiirA5_439440 [Rhizophagus irregularis]
MADGCIAMMIIDSKILDLQINKINMKKKEDETNQIFILAFVLFATLFVVNVVPLALEKRDIGNQPCLSLPPGVVGLNVIVTPNPVPGTEEIFDIKGTMKKDIVTGDFLSIAFIDDVMDKNGHRS